MKAGIDAEIADVLTDEQRELWQNLKNHGPEESQHAPRWQSPAARKPILSQVQ